MQFTSHHWGGLEHNTRTDHSLLDGSVSQNAWWFAVGAKEIQKAMGDFMPYRFKGQQLKKKRLKGDFAFHSPSRVAIKHGGRLTYRTKFSGKKVKVNLKGIAFATKSHARKAERALSGGGYMDVEVRVYLDKAKKHLILDGHCARVKLNKENTSDNRDMLRDALNSKFFRYPRKMPIPKALTGMSPQLVATPNHFILVGKK